MKAISKEQIDALQRYGLEYEDGLRWMDCDNNGEWVKLSDLCALYDNAPSVSELETERESLIAENAMMREALRDLRKHLDADEFDRAYGDLLSAKPRMVEVAKVTNNGSQLSLTKPDGSY